MGRSFRYALVAVVLLIVTELLSLALAVPAKTVTLSPVPSYPAPDWMPGRIETQTRQTNGVRLIQDYASTATGDTASVETRCGAEPKEFLKWTGRLAYEGAGYEQVSRAVDRLTAPQWAQVSDAIMRNASGRVVILYAYLDHWGIHAQTLALWPRAVVDLLTRHAGLYCESAVAVPIKRSQQQAVAEARALARVFLTRIDRSVKG